MLGLLAFLIFYELKLVQVVYPQKIHVAWNKTIIFPSLIALGLNLDSIALRMLDNSLSLRGGEFSWGQRVLKY